MTSMLKNTLLASAVVLACFGSAQAETKDTVADKRGNIAVNTFGNCVRTKWDNATDACGQPAAPAPAPVAAAAPVAAPQPVAQLSKEARTIYFDFNKDKLTTESVAKLDTLVTAIKASNGVTRANIIGYTDEIGSDGYNQKLSERRADVVKNYIGERVTVDTRVAEIRGLGKSNPVSDCKGIKARKAKIACLGKDRRTEVEFEYQN